MVNIGEPLISSESTSELIRKAEGRLSSLRHARTGPDGEARFEASRALGVLYLEQNNLELADRRIRKALSLAKLLYGDDATALLWVRNYIGVVYYKRNDLKRALDTFADVLHSLNVGQFNPATLNAKRRKSPEDQLYIIATKNYAGVLYAMGNHKEAASALAPLSELSGSGSGVDNEDKGLSDHEDNKSPSSAIAATLAKKNKNNKRDKKRSSLRQRLSYIIGTGARDVESKQSSEGSTLEFFFDMPVGKVSGAAASRRKTLAKEESESMQVPIVDLLDHISSMLADARRSDHIELLFQAALSGSYGHLSKVEEQQISLRLSLLLSSDSSNLYESMAILQRALAITEEVFGKDDIQVGIICGELGTLYARRTDLDSAEEHFQRALSIVSSQKNTHEKEEALVENMAVLRKLRTKISSKTLNRLVSIMDDEWVLKQNHTDLSAVGLSRTLYCAIELENLEKETAGWYNWRGNERKKALLAYCLEVFRDNSRIWEEEVAPKYLSITLGVRHLLGLSLARVPTNKIDLALAKAEKSAVAPASSRVMEALLRRKSVRKSQKTHSTRMKDRRGVATNASGGTRFMNANVDMHQLLSQFFAIYSPNKNDSAFIDKFLQRYKMRQMALIEMLELKYNVKFSSDGSWVDVGSDRQLTLTRKPNRTMQEEKMRSSSDSSTSEESEESEEKDDDYFDEKGQSSSVPDVDESGTISEDVSMRQALQNFYREFAPDRADAVETILVQFQGRHKDLFTALQKKYGVQFMKNGHAVPLSRESQQTLSI